MKTIPTMYELLTRETVEWTDEFEIWGEKVALQDMDQAQFGDLLTEKMDGIQSPPAIFERHIYNQLNIMYNKKFEGVDLTQ